MSPPGRLCPSDARNPHPPLELAERWQRRVEWIREHAEEFGGFKVGGYWRFDPDDIERYENRRKTRDPLSMTDLSAKRQAGKEAT